jgi:hypothetical protein
LPQYLPAASEVIPITQIFHQNIRAINRRRTKPAAILQDTWKFGIIKEINWLIVIETLPGFGVN